MGWKFRAMNQTPSPDGTTRPGFGFLWQASELNPLPPDRPYPNASEARR